MFYTELFDFGSRTLKLKTIKELDFTLKKNIQFFLDKLTLELNHNSKDSDAKHFNDAQTNIPVFLSSEFIDFLEFNIDFYIHTKADFNPFVIDDKGFVDIRSYILKDKKNESIIKLKSLTFETSFFRTSYILELLKKYLSENQIEDFSMILPNIIQSVGKYTWESTFEESEFLAEKIFHLKNSSAILIQGLNSTINTHGVHEMICIGKNLSQLKLLEPKLAGLIDLENLKSFAEENSINIVVAGDSPELKVFSGMD